METAVKATVSSKGKILYGTDPEMVAVYEKDGKLWTLPPFYFRSVFGVPASDDPRHPVFIQTPVSKFHEDGAAFEMSIRPSHNPRDLFEMIWQTKLDAEAKIISLFPNDCLPELQFLPAVGFDVQRWNEFAESRDDEFRENFLMSTRFGCDPDIDAFNSQAACVVEDASQHPYRYCGGHIHFSGSPLFEKEPILAVQSLALTVGCASVVYSDVPELEKLRTYLYGRPGKFRVQEYGERNPFGKRYAVGVEYRTPSATWCKDWNIAQKLFEWAEVGIHNLLEGGLAQELIPALAPTATKAIVEQNREMAWEVLNEISARA